MTSLFTYIYFLLSGILKDVAISALRVTATDEVVGVSGGNATFRISIVVESGEHLYFIQLVKISTDSEIFNTYYIGPQGPSSFDGAFHVNYSSRASTDYSAGKTDFTITLSQLTSDDEGQYKVNVRGNVGMKSSYTRLVVDSKPTAHSVTRATRKDTNTIKPTGNGDGGDTMKPTGNGEGGGSIKPTETGEASAGRDDTPNKIVIGAACVAMAMISTIG